MAVVVPAATVGVRVALAAAALVALLMMAPARAAQAGATGATAAAAATEAEEAAGTAGAAHHPVNTPATSSVTSSPVTSSPVTSSPVNTAAVPTSVLPFGFFHAGHFQQMLRTGDLGGKLELARLSTTPGHWGLGAMAGLSGEVVQLDGRILISDGAEPQGRVRAARPDEQALLFAGARVSEWVEVPVPRKLDLSGLAGFVAGAARARGLSMREPFVFRIVGRLPTVKWHVLTGAATVARAGQGPHDRPAHGSGHGSAHGSGHGSGHDANHDHGHDPAHAGHANQRAAARVFTETDVLGQLVGVYSGIELEGVVTHPGERLHVHFVDAKAERSGHAEDYSAAAGAILLLPRVAGH